MDCKDIYDHIHDMMEQTHNVVNSTESGLLCLDTLSPPYPLHFGYRVHLGARLPLAMAHDTGFLELRVRSLDIMRAEQLYNETVWYYVVLRTWYRVI